MVVAFTVVVVYNAPMPIYFVHALGTNYVKIGFASRPMRRLHGLQTSSPHELKMLAVTVGTIADERAMHKRFKAHHVRGEWFMMIDDLDEYIAQIVPYDHSEPTTDEARARVARYVTAVMQGKQRRQRFNPVPVPSLAQVVASRDRT